MPSCLQIYIKPFDGQSHAAFYFEMCHRAGAFCLRKGSAGRLLRQQGNHASLIFRNIIMNFYRLLTPWLRLFPFGENGSCMVQGFPVTL